MDRRNWLLLAVDAAGASGLTPAQLQKSLFLLERASPEKLSGFYNFSPYNYGPFSKQIYDDAEEMAGQGNLVIAQAPGMRFSEYIITPQGQEVAANLRRRAEPQAVEYLQRVVAWARKQSFSQLIRAIYKQYPEFRVNSVFQD
jgi:uncharacterized protein YwgA